MPGGGSRLWTGALRHPAAATALAATLLMLPVLVLGAMPNHSSPQNLTWAAQFAEGVRGGNPYPRWMPRSFDGLGSPAFYFYQPLAFFLDAAVAVATFDLLSLHHRLALDYWLLLWASGLAMRAWLSHLTPNRAAVLIGALAYIAAPYHQFDHYTRGAFGEFGAYAVLPLVALGLHRTAKRQADGPVLLAGAYGALLLMHLPTAVLVSFVIIPIHCVFSAARLGSRREAVAFVLRAALAGVLGCGLAAAYLLPALSLQEWISAEQLWTPNYAPENWFVLTPWRWPDPSTMWTVSSLAGGYLMLAVALAAMLGWANWRTECLFWTGLCVFCLVLMSGLLPWPWQFLPVLAKVQFPWRILVVVEFALITAAVLAPLRSVLESTSRALLLLATMALAPAVAMLTYDVAVRVAYTLAHAEREQQDVKEYLPAGYPRPTGARYAELGLDPVKALPLVACGPAASLCRAQADRDGSLRVQVDSTAPVTVVLRRFYFPSWWIDSPDGLPVAGRPDGVLRLLSFTAPASASTFHVHVAALPIERWGWAVSAMALLALVGMASLSRRRADGGSPLRGQDRPDGKR